MADPISIGTLVAGALGAGAGFGASKLFGGSSTPAAPAAAAAPAPPATIVPASAPTSSKPKPGGMQQSFLSGVAAGGLPGGTSTGSGASSGKTLLGA